MDFDAELNPEHIELAQFYPRAPEVVWRALTDSDVVAQWFLRSVGYSARVGDHFMFLIPSDPPAEIACEVVESVPASRLRWEWLDMRSASPVRWPVSWTITAHGRGTRLALLQTGFDLSDKRQKMARSGMSRFWRTPFVRLGTVLACR